MDYKARMYDAFTGRFIQPDTVVPEPGSSQGYNRYAYTNNNPINYSDPTGHKACDDESGCLGAIPVSPSTDPEDNDSKTIISQLSFGISTSENEPITIKNWQGFVIGNQGSGLDYFGDYLEDPVLLTKNPLALAPAFLDWLLRFKSLLPTQDQNGGQNFFIDYQFTFHYPNEYLTIDNLSISNYYTENPLYLRSIKIENGENKYLIVNQNEKLNSGFGADYAFTNLPIALDPHYPTQIEFYLYGIGVMNAGNGPINWPYKFSVYIPNTLE